ncbi:transporter substrate-binding domain-containing protein [Seohaeicola saemankumensis]|uniref:Transporter substrate-binding domain-containing protein n=1 Tax=Seohaeicola saemankumensis TaxID=481181 RepID=A0ABW3THT1_9RHOB
MAGLAFLPVQALAENITIGTDEAYDARIFTLEPSTLEGFDKAFAEIVCSRANLSCEWKTMPYDVLSSALRDGDVDIIIAAIPSNAELGAGVEKTVAYLQPDPFLTVGPPGTELHKHVKHLGSIADPVFDGWFPTTGYTNVVFPTIEAAVEAIETGEADAVIGERATLEPLIAGSGGKLVKITENAHLRPGVSMVLRSGDVDLRFNLEDRIFDMTQDGSLNALTEEWFGIDAAQW